MLYGDFPAEFDFLFVEGGGEFAVGDLLPVPAIIAAFHSELMDVALMLALMPRVQAGPADQSAADLAKALQQKYDRVKDFSADSRFPGPVHVVAWRARSLTLAARRNGFVAF